MADKDKVLVAQEQALGLFLESLLKETEQTDTAVDVKVEAETGVQTTPSAATEQQTQTVVEESVVVADEIDTPVPLSPPDTTVYESHFQAMLFDVSGLRLAIPLVELSGVLEWSDEITAMPGHADFYLGLLQHLGQSIPIIDTAKIVFPANKLAEATAKPPEERIKRIVLIDDSRWGLACDRVDEVIELTPEQVKWRPEGNSRQWLAGTVIEQMCALINGRGFAKMLESGQK